MKLFFDARYIKTDYHDGISRYSVELGNSLHKLVKDMTFIICDDKQKNYFPVGSKVIKIHPGTSPKEPLTAVILNKFHPDVVYSPMQTIGLTGRKFKAVITSHDMIYFRHKAPPKSFSPIIRLGWWLYHLTYLPERKLLNSADIVTTVSHATAHDFKNTKLTKRLVVVVPNAPQKFNSKKVQHNSNKVTNLVYMGSFMDYKNVETLIKAMKWLPGRKLHLLSKISDNRRYQLLKIADNSQAIIFHNGVSDDQYEKLLANNAVLVSASLDEGYGLPVAEALAVGVPAIISDIPVFHEVGGEGALYFSPKNPVELADAVKKIDDQKFRQNLTAKGKKHIDQFSWDKSAQILYKAIKSLL